MLLFYFRTFESKPCWVLESKYRIRQRGDSSTRNQNDSARPIISRKVRIHTTWQHATSELCFNIHAQKQQQL